MGYAFFISCMVFVFVLFDIFLKKLQVQCIYNLFFTHQDIYSENENFLYFDRLTFIDTSSICS